MIKSDLKDLRQDISNSIVNSTDNTFLYIGGHHFPQELMNNARTVSHDIDMCITTWWTWKNTEFGGSKYSYGPEPYYQGPLLIELIAMAEIASPLLDHFLHHWAPEQVGIILQSPCSGDDLHKHLQSLIWFQGSQKASKHRLNLQNPNRLLPWFESFATSDLEEFMGPISSISWLQKCGYEEQWLTQTNHKPELRLQTVGWFHYDSEHKKRYNKSEQHFQHKELASQVMHIKGYDEKTALDEATMVAIHAETQGIRDQVSISLAMQVHLLVKDDKASEELLNLLANNEIPLDVRNKQVQKRLAQI